MSGFQVVPEDLLSYSAQLDRASDNARKSAAYLDSNMDIGGGFKGLLLTEILGTHDKARNTTHGILRHLGDLTDQSSQQLKAAAKYYRTADRNATVRADEAFPGVQPRNIPQPSDKVGATFQDGDDPERFLEKPEASEMSELQQIIENPASIYDYFSPSHWILKILSELGVPDPVEGFTKTFVGNWEDVFNAGTALENAGNASAAIGWNIYGGNVSLAQTWKGNAAGAAYNYFDGLQCQVVGQQGDFIKLGDSYHTAASGIWRIAETVSAIIKDIFDDALVAAAAGAAGTGTAETVIGPVIGWGIAGIEAERIWEKYKRTVILTQSAFDAMNLFVGNVNATLDTGGMFQNYPLPGNGYKFPIA